MVIQRSWKILSDTGSTSASSTEANRSPSGLHSSSDDSNCSNQTTHSMVTSVASPLAVTSVAAAVVNAARLDVLLPTIATPTTTASTNLEQMKFVTTPHMAETMLQRLRQRLGCPVVAGGSGSNSESAMRSLELLRISVQSYFDNEIDAVMQRFMENYFKPAFTNIKENLGQSAVSEDTLQKMSCALLENAKAQYNAFRIKPQQLQSVAYLNTTPNTEHAATIRVAIKRPAVKTITNNNEHLQASKKPCTASLVTTNQQLQMPIRATIALTSAQHILPLQQQQQQQFKTAPTPPITVTSPASTTPIGTATALVPAAARRQIFWNTANICNTTKFVLDVQANQAFGFGRDGKERLASKHPELIRYLPDSEDRDWLTAQNIISQLNRNSRFLFLIHDEVCRLQATHENYRNKASVDLGVMHTFNVPEFMIQKMRLFFVDLNIKSRGLITNSFSVGNSHLRNALLQGIQPVGVMATSLTSSADVASTTTTSIATIASTVGGGGGGVSTDVLVAASTASNNGSVSTSSEGVVISTVSLPLKPKTSTLSSSHATLTALLNNSGTSGPAGTVGTTSDKVVSVTSKARK